MRVLFLVILLMNTLVAVADDSKHMVTFGRHGFGWGTAHERMETKSNSPFDEVKFELSDISLNYAYRISSRWQLGGFYQNSHVDNKFQRNNASNSFARTDMTVYGIFGLYNLSEELKSTFFLGTAISYFSLAEENSHNWTETEGKAPFELDDAGNTYELIFGKRFSFEKWNIHHLTYAPTVSIYYRDHSKDFDDQGIKNGIGFNFQILKFDFLF